MTISIQINPKPIESAMIAQRLAQVYRLILKRLAEVNEELKNGGEEV